MKIDELEVHVKAGGRTVLTERFPDLYALLYNAESLVARAHQQLAGHWTSGGREYHGPASVPPSERREPVAPLPRLDFHGDSLSFRDALGVAAERLGVIPRQSGAGALASAGDRFTVSISDKDITVRAGDRGLVFSWPTPLSADDFEGLPVTAA